MSTISAAPSKVSPSNTFTVEPAILVPLKTNAVSSVVSPDVSAPVTEPSLSVATIAEAVGAVVSTVTVFVEAADKLPAASTV